MKAGLLAIALLAPLASCGGRTRHDASEPAAPNASAGSPCVTSQGCPIGMRCDAGACGPDTSCPPAQAPRLLLDTMPGSPWAVIDPQVVELDGHELLLSSAEDIQATALRLYDLATGEQSALPHPTGVAYCWGDPATCVATDYSAFTLYQGLTLSGGVWSAASERRYDVSGSPSGSAADLAARRIPIWDTAPTISLLDLDSGQVLFALPLPASFAGTRPDAQGRTAAIETLHNGLDSFVMRRAPFEAGATFSVVYQGDSSKFTAPLLTNGNPPYVVRDNGLGDALTMRIERVTATVPTTLGTLSDPPASALDRSYGYSASLEPGNAMYALDCVTDRRCRTFLIQLDAVTAEPLDSVPWPDDQSVFVSSSRRLACGGRDLIVSAGSPSSAQKHIWSLRLQGRAGLP